MFEAEQFIASSRSSSSLSSLPLPPLHHSNNAFTTPFVLYPTTTTTNLFHQQSPTQKIIEEDTDCVVVDYLESTSSTQRDRLAPELVDSWSNDELLSLFRIRSSFENWFPEFTWELVSRKLAELGFKRSAGKCKEKFEEESNRYLNNINYSKSTTSDMIFSEFQELYKPNQEEQKGGGGGGGDEDPRINDELLADARMNSNSHEEAMMFVEKSNNKKRKRQKKKKKMEKFEMFKSLCEDVVNKLMTRQEEMQNKLIEDMVKRDEEKVAREEALKKQEMDRIHKELEFRAHEQVVASDGQDSLINYLKLFSSSSSTATPCDLVNHKVQNPNPTIITKENPIAPTSLADDLARQNPNSASTNKKLRLCSDVYKEDIGRRWPREEVLALINLRCNLCDTNHHHHHQDNINIKEGGSGGLLKAPLWERISQGMLDLGYMRSAKRCKEKWENINKYFRKTKDISKRRSLESRTCPYFQRLSTFYTQGTLVPPPSTLLENPRADSSLNGSNNSTMDGLVEGEKNMVQVVPPAVAAFEFEF